MTLQQITQVINSINEFEENKLYFLYKINDCSGFLYGNGKVYFINKSTDSIEKKINTQFLLMSTNVFLDTVERNPSFKRGYYDMLLYKGEIKDEYFKSFIELCCMYIKSNSSITFTEFFNSLLEIFETTNETNFLNAIGLFGELSFIKYIYEKYQILLCNQWHNNLGSIDKYDFSFEHFNIEVKTTLKDGMCFNIKHSQIFNNKNNYIAVINITNDNSGQSLSDIYDYFKNNSIFSNNFPFMMNLEKEKHKVNSDIFENHKFELVRVKFFNSKEIATITNIPSCIHSVSYMYDFSEKDSISFENIINLIKEE